jgi:hypothetical protein
MSIKKPFNWEEVKDSKSRTAFKDLTAADIAEYCKQNNCVDWFKATIKSLQEEEAQHMQDTSTGKKPRKYGDAQLRRRFLDEQLKLPSKTKSSAPKSYWEKALALIED